MDHIISKSKFKPNALKYFRDVEQTGREIIITDRGKKVLRIVPFREEPQKVLQLLRNSVVKYDNPLEPVGLEDWEALK